MPKMCEINKHDDIDLEFQLLIPWFILCLQSLVYHSIGFFERVCRQSFLQSSCVNTPKLSA
jgi:uncharacterized protein (UPF0333 family)